jgi:PAS domain S-box-containing protein
MRIKTKMLLSILLTTSLIYIGAIGYISMRYRVMAVKNAEELANTTVREYANQVETSLNEDIAVGRSMAQVFTGYQSLTHELREQIYDEFLENILTSNKRYFAVFLQWEIGTVDPGYQKPYGRIRKAANWVYEDTPSGKRKIQWVVDTLDTAGDDTTGIYYYAKSTGNEVITNPYFYSYNIEEALPSNVPVSADDVLESTIIIPFFNDGKYVGMTGMDIPLNSFQKIIAGIKPFENSYSFLAAHDGSLVAHPILANSYGSITNIDSIFTEEHQLISYIQQGEPYSFIDHDATLGKIYVSIVPVSIGRTKTPWAMGIAVPVDLIEAEAMDNFYIAIAVGLVGLIILTIIIWIISGNITRPLVGTTAVLKKLARGSVDDAMVQQVKTSDEIGEMTASANTLVHFLRSTAMFATHIGEGNLEADHKLLSDEDILGNALLEMRNKLKASNEKIMKQSIKLLEANRELEKLSVVARETDNAVIIMDAEGKLEWVNEGLKKLYGYTFEEYISEKGSTFFEVSTNAEVKNLFEKCKTKKKTVQYVSKNNSKSGKVFWAQTTLTPVLSEEGEVIKLVSIDSDISRLIQAEEEISNYAKKVENQRDTLEELNATKDRFFAIIAHDLKNPFGALHSMIDTIHEGYSNFDDEERVFYLEHIRSIVNRIYNLLDNLLLWATSQTGRISFQQEEVDVRELVKENIRLAMPAAKNKEVILEEKVMGELSILADRNMISTVLRNLISNAIKYSSAGKKVVIKAYAVSQGDNNNFVEISVRDNGVGIDNKTIDNLFRIDKNPSTRGTADEIGSGLGLILCKEFVMKNGGKIWVESQLDKGSVFSFTLMQFQKNNAGKS